MSQLNLSKKTIKIIYEGKEYVISKPSTRQLDDFAKNKKQDSEAVVKFLAGLGFPESVAWDIEAENLREIIKIVCPPIDEKKT